MKPGVQDIPLEQAPVVSPSLRKGDIFTIAGTGIGLKGQSIVAGRSVLTGRKCRVVKLSVFTVTARSKS